MSLKRGSPGDRTVARRPEKEEEESEGQGERTILNADDQGFARRRFLAVAGAAASTAARASAQVGF